MKKLLSLLITVLTITALVAFSLMAHAASDKAYIHDYAGVLTQDEASSIKSKLEDVSLKYGIDVVIAIVPEDITDAEAEAIYDDNGYGTGNKRDGIITVIITDKSLYANTVISLAGNLSEKSTVSAVIDEFDSSYKQKLAADDYTGAIDDCIKAESRYIEAYQKEIGFHLAKKILISLAVGFVISGIVVLVMKGKLKSVRVKSAAADYVVPGSFNLRESRDLFLYANVTKTPRAQDSNKSGGGGSHISAGGVSHSTGRF